MTLRGYIPFEKTDIPYQFEIDLANKPYIMVINYNKSEAFFSLDIMEQDLEPIVLGERLVLNERLWADIVDERLPSIDLVPMDESGAVKELTFENFMEKVFLYEDSLPPNMEEPSIERQVFTR